MAPRQSARTNPSGQIEARPQFSTPRSSASSARCQATEAEARFVAWTASQFRHRLLEGAAAWDLLTTVRKPWRLLCADPGMIRKIAFETAKSGWREPYAQGIILGIAAAGWTLTGASLPRLLPPLCAPGMSRMTRTLFVAFVGQRFVRMGSMPAPLCVLSAPLIARQISTGTHPRAASPIGPEVSPDQLSSAKSPGCPRSCGCSGPGSGASFRNLHEFLHLLGRERRRNELPGDRIGHDLVDPLDGVDRQTLPRDEFAHPQNDLLRQVGIFSV